jgi:hypothetical protein
MTNDMSLNINPEVKMSMDKLLKLQNARRLDSIEPMTQKGAETIFVILYVYIGVSLFYIIPLENIFVNIQDETIDVEARKFEGSSSGN